jgi:uncharacterized GH25 family protein
LVTLLILAVAGTANAHEIKAFASRQTLPDGGGKTTVFLSWGHRVPVDELVDAAPIERYDLIAPNGTVAALKKDGVSLQANAVEVKDTGVHSVIVTRKPSMYTYVLGDGDERQLKRGPKTEHAGVKVESGTKYLQAGKALIVVGKPGDAVPKPFGLPVEITPLDGPAKWVAGKDVRFQILLDGKPVPVAEVHARSVGFKPDDAWNFATESDRKGEFVVRPDKAGTWVVKVTVKKLTQGKTRDEYDFESFTATLTLEVFP